MIAKTKKAIAVRVDVPREDLGYDVLCGAGIAARVGSIVRKRAPEAQRIALITDDNVGPLHAESVRASLNEAGFEVHDMSVPAGEASKSPAQLQSLLEQMLDARLSRKDIVLTLGGGVVGDLGGLAAASFMRGIDFVQVPTSLLAQVDASVGGKVAIDLPAGKNLWGAFHFPRVVIIDPNFLRTLDQRQLASGIAEMLKHGALFSAAHFDEIVAGAPAILAHDTETTARLVAASVAYKATCVAKDPRETDASASGRVVLNLGHTVGHALESLSNFELLHGEAVGLGLLATARISQSLSGAPASLAEQMRRGLDAAQLPTDLDAWVDKVGRGALITFMRRDKKRDASAKISLVTLSAIAQPRLHRLEAAQIAALLQPPKPAS